MMETHALRGLALSAAKIRSQAKDQVYTAASGHVGGSLSVADILAVL